MGCRLGETGEPTRSRLLAHYNAYYLTDPPTITGQPAGGYYLVGHAAQMSVAASGAQLNYQWYKNGVLIPGATDASMGSASLTADDSGTYHVTVSNPSGSTNSEPARLQVGNHIARYQSAVLGESSLLSYYTFDAGDGQDSKGLHPGVVMNATTYSAGPGRVTNLALTLDGTGHLALGLVGDFEFTSGNGTVESWIRPTWANLPGYAPCLFANRNGPSVWSVHMTEWKNEIGNWNGVRFQTLPVAVTAGWHHYAIAFEAGKVLMYWDGQPLGEFPQAINNNSGQTTQIGSSASATTSEGWIGDVDEVAFYSTTLDAATIWDHFLAMVGPATAGPPTLSISRNGKQVALSWPPEVSGFILEYSDTLPGTNWMKVNGVVDNSITVDASSGDRFYRLKSE